MLLQGVPFKTDLTTTVFVSFGDISTTNELFFSFYLEGGTCRIALQQVLKMSTAFSKTSIHFFYLFILKKHVSCNFVKCFWVSFGNSLFSIVFQFLKTSWVIQINYFVEKSPQKEIWQGKVGDCGGQRPRLTMRSNQNPCRKAAVVFTVWAIAPSC
jgi:hypothetical protein